MELALGGTAAESGRSAAGASAMSSAIRESDWRLFRQLRPIALERFCERVLSELGRLAADIDKPSHERYLAVFKLIKRRDRELAQAFDDPHRSTAMQQLACIQSHDLLTEEEFSRFSPETRETVQFLVEAWRS
jgi:hypothetical protein